MNSFRQRSLAGQRADSALESGARIRLRGPGAMAAAMPYMLGFHPSESLVGFGLAADRRRVRLTARIDLQRPPFRQEAATLAAYLKEAEAVEVVLLVVSELPLSIVRRAAGAARAAARRAGLTVSEVIHVYDARWRSLSCRNAACCPPGGRQIDEEAAAGYAAELAALGRAVLPDRAAVQASVSYQPSAEVVEVRAAYEAAREAQTNLATSTTIEAMVDAGERIFGAAVVARRDGPRELTAAEVGELGAALAVVTVRDRALRWTISPLADAAESIWRQLVHRLPPPLAAPPATLLAIWAYAEGDGTLAKVSLERALAEDPDYGMAQLVDEILARAIAPSEFSATIRQAWFSELRFKRTQAAAKEAPVTT
ncbi:DUF4192 domain-containing protein [Fodinicola feengrottensis]|uniref:DUF4192 family protein n=1 Tax=Fodinicola feengrottensis TaxID=435914 RepID=A0ABN2J551_9ACTN|nr:DUF4192 domain-containing protein [Fodinicola feengrottensis]